MKGQEKYKVIDGLHLEHSRPSITGEFFGEICFPPYKFTSIHGELEVGSWSEDENFNLVATQPR